ncbi:MAG: ECF-type sigma factor, partial [Pseudomonadales bacterium]
APMGGVTQILSAIDGGDAQAAERLLPLIYDELRKLAAQKMAQETPGQTLSCRDKPVTSGFETGYLDETGLCHPGGASSLRAKPSQQPSSETCRLEETKVGSQVEQVNRLCMEPRK